ncbi:MAG: hypothetical protein ACXIUM_11285 [Wenzhouxiangella sp.]
MRPWLGNRHFFDTRGSLAAFALARHGRRWLICSLLGLWAAGAMAQSGIQVGAGSSMDIGGGTVDLGCGTLQVDGAIAGRWQGVEDVNLGPEAFLQTSLLEFGGDWQSSGAQQIGGQVSWQEQCGRSAGEMRGSNQFAALSITSEGSITRQLEVGAEQVVNSQLLLAGSDSDLLRLRSTQPGSQALLTVRPGAGWFVDRVDVADINSLGGQALAPGAPALVRSVDSGNNSNWFLSAVPIPVPAFGWPALLLLALALLWVGRYRLGGLDRARGSLPPGGHRDPGIHHQNQ